MLSHARTISVPIANPDGREPPRKGADAVAASITAALAPSWVVELAVGDGSLPQFIALSIVFRDFALLAQDTVS
jgi:hypothetical protein